MGSVHSKVSPQSRSSAVIDITFGENQYSVREAQKSRLKRRLCEMSGVRQSDISKAISIVETCDDILDSFRVLLDAMDSIFKEDRETIVACLRNISPLFVDDGVNMFSWMSSCGDFVALIGGVERTMSLYKNTMNIQEDTVNMHSTLTDAGRQRLNRNVVNLEDTMAEDTRDTKEIQKSKKEKKGKQRDKKHRNTEITEDELESETKERDEEQDKTVLHFEEFSTDKDFEGQSTQTMDESSQVLIQELLYLWLCITNASLLFCSRLAEAGILKYLVQFLAKPSETSYLDNITRITLCILHNCAKDPHFRQELRDLDTVRVLSDHYLHVATTEIRPVILLTLSYSMDEDDNNSVVVNCDEMLFLLEGIGVASHSKLHLFQNWHLQDLLQGVLNLAENEDYKLLLVEMDALRFIKPVIKDGNDNEKLLAMKTTWQLAFAEENKKKIKEDSELMRLVHGVKSSWPADSEMSTCARGILFVLNIDSITKSSEQDIQDLTLLDSPQQKTSSDRQRPGHVMISYQHFSRDILRKVCRCLRQNQYRVWMDVDNIGGHSSTLEAMAKAVEDADAVLLCMSEHYKDKPNCRLEAEYAFDKGKVIIPLLMQKGYKPNGWLGILKGSKLYIDFSGKYSFEEQIEKLIAELGGRGQNLVMEDVDGSVVRENSSILMVPSLPAKARKTSSETDVGQWSQSDVAQWLKSHRLQGCKHLKNLSGENLVCLQKLRREVPEFFFTFLKQDFELSSFDLLHFSDAVDKLPT